MWYKRSEAQKRYTLFFSSTQLAGAFGGLLASAIGKMNGIRGYHAWRYIFILEGLLTCVIAFASFFIISDFPDDAKWLSEDERAYINARLQAEQGGSTTSRRIEVHDIVKVFTDYKVFLGGIMYFSLIVPAYGMYTQIIDFRMPDLLRDMLSSQVMHTSLPPSSKHTATAKSRPSYTRFPLLPPLSYSLYSSQSSLT